MRALRVFCDALIAALVLLAAEAALVSLSQHAQFADTAELRLALRLTPLLAWLPAAPVAVLGAFGLLLVRAVTSARHGRAVRVLLTVLAALAAGSLGVLLSTGRHFAALPVRAASVGALSLLAAGVVWALAPVLGRLERRWPARVGLGALVVAVVLIVANALVLPRLYPAFHVALGLLTVLACAWMPLLWHGDDAHRAPAHPRRIAAVAVVLAAALAGVALRAPSLLRSIERADTLRFVLGEHAPTVGLALRLLGRTGAEPAGAGQGATALAGPGGSAAPATGETLDWRSRDILLITVDAMRSDRLGVHGYQRHLTPFLDELATTGTSFDAAYTATPHTSYAISSLMTGKYMRPLLRQGTGGDPDTFAGLLRSYGYRTAAFYPPAVFFIDPERFIALRDRALDFEYRKIEPAPLDRRNAQVATYLGKLRPERHVFLWVHLFEPHEPYEAHPGIDLGARDVDRYDAEIAAVDAGVKQLVEQVRAKRPGTIVLFSADHGEEFGEHGGRYHGTTVYEEQVRVPLIVQAPGLVPARRISAPVQTIDLLPTVLSALHIPRPARVRGRDLGLFLGPAEPPASDPGFAFAETDEATLLAEGSLRLICARQLGACRLFDVATDPGETRDATGAAALERQQAMRTRLREVEAAHGRYEQAGLRAEGRAWPEAIRRGLAGDGDAALEVSALLDDADLTYRRKAAEVLFELARPETAAALRLALTRDEDDRVRRWAALALTRLGEGAGRTLELIEDPDPAWRRLAALALAEHGDGRGEDTLVAWWQSGPIEFTRARQIITALGQIRAKHAVVPLIRSLDDLRLRPYLAAALAQIGESAARPALLEAFAAERYLPGRTALGEALIKLGAGAEMAPPLVRFLGTPDPLPGGLSLAERGKFLPSIGGPDGKDLPRLRDGRGKTRRLQVIVPRGGNGRGVRLLVLGRSTGATAATLRLGHQRVRPGDDDSGPVEIDQRSVVELSLEPSPDVRQIVLDLPAELGVKPGTSPSLALWQSEQAEVSALAIVPLADELPPPPPEPWTPPAGQSSDESVDDAP